MNHFLRKVVKKGPQADPFEGQVLFDMSFTNSTAIQTGNLNITPAYPRGFQTTLGSDGKYGFDFNSNRYIQLPYTSELSPTVTNATFEFWFIQRSIGNMALFSQDRYGANFDRCLILYNDNLRTSSNGTTWILDSPTGGAISASLNTPSHAAFVKTGNYHKVFFNGVRYGNSNLPWSNNGNAMTIGCASWNNPNTFLNAIVSRIRITSGSRYE